jgi:hypothetical protein
MKPLEVLVRLWSGRALVVVLVACVPCGGAAQTDQFTGTWVLNAAKSAYKPGPPPKSQSVVYDAFGQGIKVTARGTDAQGAPTSTLYTAAYDGKDYPVIGNPDWDATSLKRIDAFTVEFVRKKAGRVVQTGTNVVSKDGRTRTIITTGVDARGRTISNTAVYERM